MNDGRNKITNTSTFLEQCSVDLGHQEVQAILTEIEQIFESQPEGWLPVSAIGNLVAYNLGYEDIDELNSAINMEFSTFMQGFPHIQTKTNPKKTDELLFRVRPEKGKELWQPRKMVFKINSTKDLWTVFLKSKYAVVRIPELEDFEIRPDGRRQHIDTIYNHIGNVIHNLGNHVRGGQGQFLSNDTRYKIMETVYKMNLLLDVPFPFTWEVRDPSGISEFKPSTAVQISPYIQGEEGNDGD
eukprot:jgi/Bigna1/55241/estExt_Genewise1Plus.C_540076